MNNDKILFIYTGGTIGSWPTPQGYVPKHGFDALIDQQLGDAAHEALGNYDLVELDELLDSSNIQPNDWTRLAEMVVRRYEDYSGFVILHGTDTMAYSASALSFMLRGLTKPVILTGAQIPLSQPRTDAVRNLLDAVHYARHSALHEVAICFGGRLIRGNRATKAHTSALQAFDSPNFPLLSEAGIQPLPVSSNLPEQPLRFMLPSKPSRVAQLALYPGIIDEQIDAVLNNPDIAAVVLQTFGAGNPPDRNQHLMNRLAEANQRGVIVVNSTLCHGGPVVQGTYATGARLKALNVISGQDMTLEAAFCKLHYLLGRNLPTQEVRELMGQSLAGEVTLAED
ncbi:type I asparaginase [Neptunomonas sp. XY-337]|uniref:type I asparaginase n=1 Tax=Neptunomonas sp. XY-337 TaxID=2561897 RepID=UPI0010A9ABE4|nr:type I asparaginase [Neptunomonas sp. XY-337]